MGAAMRAAPGSACLARVLLLAVSCAAAARSPRSGKGAEDGERITLSMLEESEAEGAGAGGIQDEIETCLDVLKNAAITPPGTVVESTAGLEEVADRANIRALGEVGQETEPSGQVGYCMKMMRTYTVDTLDKIMDLEREKATYIRNNHIALTNPEGARDPHKLPKERGDSPDERMEKDLMSKTLLKKNKELRKLKKELKELQKESASVPDGPAKDKLNEEIANKEEVIGKATDAFEDAVKVDETRGNATDNATESVGTLDAVAAANASDAAANASEATEVAATMPPSPPEESDPEATKEEQEEKSEEAAEKEKKEAEGQESPQTEKMKLDEKQALKKEEAASG